MAIGPQQVLPILDTISTQQQAISERLQTLITIFKREPEPVEPILRSMLKPLQNGIDVLGETMDAHSKRSI